MSRAKIGGVVALVVAGLTATAYVLTTSSLEGKIRADVEKQVARSRDLLEKNASFDALDLIKRAEAFARDSRFLSVLDNDDAKVQQSDANILLTQAMQELDKRNAKKDAGQKEPKPDFIALLNAKGDLVAIDPKGSYEPGVFIRDEKACPGCSKAILKALDPKELRTFKDNWFWENDRMDVGISPAIDPTTGEVKGAVVVAYTLDSNDAKYQAQLLGTQVGWFDGTSLRGTSFGGKSEEAALAKLLYEKGLAKRVLEGEKAASNVVAVKMGGNEYLASAMTLPMNVSGQPAGAIVLMSLTDVMAPVSSVKLTILLLGLGALAIAILAMLFTARVILTPAEEIEIGVTEIINGNIDYSFKPVGADFDGLANALNVMLARLLGRPEPGEEEYDDEGNVMTGGGKVQLDEDTGSVQAVSAPDAETLALANEAEADYYKRIYNEYIAARKGAGEKVDGVTYEGFVAKLRLNEGSLKKKYSCKAVRFRVQTKDGQVTLKPVPIV